MLNLKVHSHQIICIKKNDLQALKFVLLAVIIELSCKFVIFFLHKPLCLQNYFLTQIPYNAKIHLILSILLLLKNHTDTMQNKVLV